MAVYRGREVVFLGLRGSDDRQAKIEEQDGTSTYVKFSDIQFSKAEKEDLQKDYAIEVKEIKEEKKDGV